jgi:hypothetical protein
MIQAEDQTRLSDNGQPFALFSGLVIFFPEQRQLLQSR